MNKFILVLSLFLSSLNAHAEGLMPVETIRFTSPNGDVVEFETELALDDKSRALGLMFRKELADDKAMAFYWDDYAVRSFWMKNTYIPLDMIFIKDSKILGIIDNVPPQTLTSRTVGLEGNGVIEIKAGMVSKHGINNNWSFHSDYLENLR